MNLSMGGIARGASRHLVSPILLKRSLVFPILLFSSISLHFYLVCCNLSFFISNFVILILFSFFLMSLAKGSSILFILSKNQLLVLLISTIVSFTFFSFISAQIFMISFLLLILGFFVLFPVALGVKLGCLFDVFLFHEVGLYCYKLPS